jgi:hypothetical protein
MMPCMPYEAGSHAIRKREALDEPGYRHCGRTAATGLLPFGTMLDPSTRAVRPNMFNAPRAFACVSSSLATRCPQQLL